MLLDDKRQQLDDIVQKMVANKEPDDVIQFVVNDFKSKYDPESGPQPELQAPQRNAVENFLLGALKGAGSTIFNIGKLGEKIANPAERALGLKETTTPRPGALDPMGVSQKAGFATEQIGEFFIPSGLASRGAALLGKFSKVPKISKLLGMTGKAAGSGVDIALRDTIQRGDTEHLVSSFLLGTTLPAVSKALSAVGKGIFQKLPERLYKQVFKVAEDDLRLAFESQAKGAKLNPTLAKEVLDRGLFGSAKNMAIYSFRKLDALEKQVQNIVRNKEPFIELSRKQDYVRLFRDVADQFGRGFFSGRAKAATRLANAFERSKGRLVKTEDALKAKRFLDNLRNSSSFRLDPTLTAKQEELKVAADAIRKTLAKNKAYAHLMNEERVFIQALDEIISDAARRQNRRLLNLTDILLGGGGLASGGPFGAAVGIGAVRGFQQPATLTGLGQGLYRAGKAVRVLRPQSTLPTLGAASGLVTTRESQP